MTRSGTSHGPGGGPADPLTAYTLAELRERRSAKWRVYPSDVLPVWVAEMDTPLAEPIATALVEAIGRGDTGYPVPGGLPEAFAGFAARRFGWHPDPAGIRLVADVMAGIVEVLSLVTEPGGRVVFNTPAYPPYFYWIPRIGREIVQSPSRSPPRGSAWTWPRSSGTSRRGPTPTCCATRTIPPAWCSPRRSCWPSPDSPNGTGCGS